LTGPTRAHYAKKGDSMGDTKLSITTKVDEKLDAQLIRLLVRFSPVIEDRSSLVRFLLTVAVAGITSGRLPDTLDGLSDYLKH
jgi:hypothetical protein